MSNTNDTRVTPMTIYVTPMTIMCATGVIMRLVLYASGKSKLIVTVPITNYHPTNTRGAYSLQLYAYFEHALPPLDEQGYYYYMTTDC